ncbi:MAG TPA: NAD(P)-dependent oxidoreductase [Methylomirabilota bacterium]|nr:NAD(P)-dependent oxidoreductase [Methylomirabilota bacterium]
MRTVGFIGLGNMGAAMASNIHQAGYALVVHDVRADAARRLAEAGARVAASPAEVARQSDVTITSLPGPPEVEAVAVGAGGLLDGMRHGGVWIDTSTSRPTLIRTLAPRFGARGAHVLDAPVSGGKTGAQSRNLAVMVGGDRAVFERVKPVLDAFGDKVFYAGAIGAGCVAKLVHNMIGHSVRQAVAEGLTLGVKAGVDAEALWECIRRGALGRMHYLHEGLPRTVFRGEYAPPMFSLGLARKDIGLATELAREYQVPMPLTNLAEQIAIAALNRGWGDQDNNVVFRLQEEAAGVEVRAPQVDPGRAARFITTHPDA